MKRLKIALTLAAWLAAALLVAGAVLRVSGLRDSWPPAAPLFYATPLPVLAALAGALACWRWRRGARVFFALAALGCCGAWVRGSWRAAAVESAPAAAFRVAYWNCAHPRWRTGARFYFIRALEADIIGLGETNATAAPQLATWREAFPDRIVTPLRGGMMLLTRDRADVIEQGRLGQNGHYAAVQLTTATGGRMRIVLVDFEASPRRDRAPAFAQLHDLAFRQWPHPTIVMGDFNTPRESVHFDGLRRMLGDAWEEAGRGLAETWPVPFPVLSLDHVLVSVSLRAVRCERKWSTASDHRAVVATLAFSDTVE